MEKYEKILIEMKHGLGDCICMLPAIKAVRDYHPNAYIALIVNGKSNEEIFRHSGININKYYHFSLKNKPFFYTLKILWELRREKFDYGILATMTPAKKGKVFFKIIHIKHALGEQFRGISFLELDNTKHFVERNLDVVSSICGTILDRQPHLYVKTSDSVSLPSNRPAIAVNIGGADKNYYKGQYVYTRDWGVGHMHELVGLLSTLNYNIFLLGGPLEKHLIADYNDLLSKENVFDFVDKTNIGETLWILSRCKLSIGVDTGMQHAADALGVPTISIFGPTNPKTHGAYSKEASFILSPKQLSCQYCFGQDIYYLCPDRKCLNQIQARDVFSRVVQKIKEKESK